MRLRPGAICAILTPKQRSPTTNPHPPGMTTLEPQKAPSDFIAGDSEMAGRIRELDWSKTPIGPVDSWSPALRMMVRFLLANRFPLLLWWGPQYVSVYNDAYRPILGAKHPWALGQPVSECWKEIWHILQPLIDTPYHGGPSTWNDDIELEINRHGFTEETHFTIAYSPVPDETEPGGVGGVLATVHEITGKVVGERRVLALRDLGARVSEAKTAEEACALAGTTLAGHAKDVPFALLYLIDADGHQARLAGTAGVAIGEDLSPVSVDLDQADSGGWPLARASRSGELHVVEGLGQRFDAVPAGPWSDPPDTAVVLSIPSARANEPAAIMVAGVSARLQLDGFYRDFFELVKSQVARAIGNARAYEEEKKRAEALAELDQAKTAFFQSVSHEFRTPLTLILGPLEDALADTTAHWQRDWLGVLHRNALRLQKLVNNLLDFSRIEAGRIQASYEPTDLAQFTAELASVFRSAVEKAGMRLIVHCPPLSEPVHVDRDMYEKVVLNLLSNAFKFTLDGQIEVLLRDAGDAVELSVQDTGTGIAAEQLPHIFERFHRVEGTRARTHEGTGIGLALVQELVKLHGGTVSVLSVAGEGSTFTVTIPKGTAHLPADRIRVGAASRVSTALTADSYLAEAMRWSSSPDPVLAADVEEARAGGPRPRIIWADDNADMREYVGRLLRPLYDVEAVSDGDGALAAARRQTPDLVLADVMMPGLDGFGLLQALRADERTRTIPVMLLSARAGEEARVEGMQSGADDYLIKPFSARELLARVDAHLKISQLRTKATADLRESEERFRTLADHAPVLIWVNSPTGCEYVNRSYLDFLGLSMDQVRGMSWTDYLHPEDASEYVGGYMRALEQRQVFEAQFRFRRADGEYRWLQSVGVPRFTPAGEFLGYSGSSVDITDIKRSEAALKEADRRKDEFLATLAHELRNPLTPIRNSLHLLRLDGGETGAAERAREMMERQVNHMVRLVDDLLEVARITRGKIEVRRQQVELAEVVRAAVETSRPLIEAARHQLHIEIPSEPLVLDADPVRLAQVLANLLNNAAKYTNEGGQVWLTARREGPRAVVSVRDSGMGIPAEMLPKVFDLFTQVDRTYGHAQGGLGIGLTLVRNLIEMHGGSVEARSDGPRRGSEFIVRLPLASARPGSRDRDSGKTQPVAVSPRRILVVDDNSDAADSLGMLLRFLGADVHTAYDGPAALEALQTYRPTVMLLDVGLPGMDGFEVARRARQRPEGQDVTLIALTGWGQEEDRRRSKEAGIDHHLVKPVDIAVLEQLLASLSGSRRSRKLDS